jgi:hypothetical protein
MLVIGSHDKCLHLSTTAHSFLTLASSNVPRSSGHHSIEFKETEPIRKQIVEHVFSGLITAMPFLFN